MSTQKARHYTGRRGKPVKDTKTGKVYPSQVAASQDTDYSQRQISYSCRNELKRKENRFEFASESNGKQVEAFTSETSDDPNITFVSRDKVKRALWKDRFNKLFETFDKLPADGNTVAEISYDSQDTHRRLVSAYNNYRVQKDKELRMLTNKEDQVIYFYKGQRIKKS